MSEVNETAPHPPIPSQSTVRKHHGVIHTVGQLLGHTLVGGLMFVMRFKQNAIFRFEHLYGVFGYHARLNVQKTVRLGP